MLPSHVASALAPACDKCALGHGVGAGQCPKMRALCRRPALHAGDLGRGHGIGLRRVTAHSRLLDAIAGRLRLSELQSLRSRHGGHVPRIPRRLHGSLPVDITRLDRSRLGLLSRGRALCQAMSATAWLDVSWYCASPSTAADAMLAAPTLCCQDSVAVAMLS